MKKQTNKRQILILTAIEAVILLGASVSTFAQASKMQSDKFAFAATNQNLWLNDSTGKFDITNLLTDKFSSAKLSAMFDLPKPDFSAMEKWFEIVKYEYGEVVTDPKLYIWVKIKTKPFPGGFQVDFRDKDGVTVGPRVQPIRDIYALSNVGDTVKTYCDLPPSETDCEKIVTATVIRVKS